MTFVFTMDPPWNTDDGGGGKGANNHATLGVDEIAQVVRRSQPWSDTGNAVGWMWATSLAFVEGQAHALANLLHMRICSGFVWAKVDEVTSVRAVPSPLEVACPACLSPPAGPTTMNTCHCDVDGAGHDGFHPARWRAAREASFAASVSDDDVFRPPTFMGLGFYQRCEHEHLLLLRRGTITVPRPSARSRSVIYAPRTPVHSEKPAKAWRLIERTTSAIVGRASGGVEFFSRAPRPGWGAWGTLDGPHTPARFLPSAEGSTWEHAIKEGE
jgi:hypothetical protein